MLVTKEVSLEGTSNYWSGGLERAERINELENSAEIWNWIETSLTEAYPEGIDETALNDYLWFDAENDIKDAFGIDIWED